MALIERMHKLLSALLHQRAANVTFTFALATIPIVGTVGTAVDYSRANAVRTAMQNALDSTALTLGKDVGTLGNTSNLASRATDHFNAVFKQPDTRGVSVSTDFRAATESLTLNATANVGTSFSRILGFKSIKVNATSTVVWGTSRKVEIALVLDNTGSMTSNGKIEALKVASKNFIDAMQKAARKSDAVKVAVVPFDTHVNLGPAYKSSSWIDWTLMDGVSGRDVNPRDGSNNYGDADDNRRSDDDRIDKENWTGCVIDRAQPYDVEDEQPGSNVATKYPAENCGLTPLLRLTTDFDAARSMLDRMKAEGKTNLTIGLVWGWHALTPNNPLPEGRTSSKDVEKIIVFLTDGLNTQNRWSTNAADIDARTREVCDNIKKAGIRLYTIRVMEGNQSLLQSCASNHLMYYNVTSAAGIAPVFEEIARSLQQLRISR